MVMVVLFFDFRVFVFFFCFLVGFVDEEVLLEVVVLVVVVVCRVL